MQETAISCARWRLGPADERACTALSRELDLSPIAARVLARRGPITPESASRFLSPSLNDLPDPFSLPGMDAAAARLALAIGSGDQVGVFGDYDADGVAGAALIAEFIEGAGGRCEVDLPRRKGDGYGITADAVGRMAGRGSRLLLTVDNGIGAHDAAARAGELGLDMIITDHHAVRGALPAAHAVVNPKLLSGASSLSDLAGCGVAFMLALATRRLLREAGSLPSPEPNLKRSLDLVALGTIADVVPLTGANRILAAFGLAEIARAARPGMRALMAASGTGPEAVDPRTVAFRLAPRINAAGRMDDPAEALRLLRAGSIEAAVPIAERLCRANRERQSIEEKCLAEALEAIPGDPADLAAIVVDSKGWHVGVIGIVASRLASRFRRPAVVITRDTSPARGSCRSFGGVDMLKALARCADLMPRFGGHSEAAGLTIEPSNIEELRRRLAAACAEFGATAPPPLLEIDAVASPHEITPRLVDELARLAPFGEGNPEPLIAMSGIGVAGTRTVGNGHLKLSLSAGGHAFEAIGFGMGEATPPHGSTVSVAFTPQWNTYNSVTSMQLKLADLEFPALAPAPILR
ncbi:MAG: single-stranded-DNA-specific exonuclease RecJ [Proteobacteria bacterium]|nr:single-stranded-DNA-specific exonuclease RecJ [Pseudomonadota bacterium]